ncbi:MAG: hypothetical protein ACKVQW_03390 [Pyrinomonadaceae bacterium]
MVKYRENNKLVSVLIATSCATMLLFLGLVNINAQAASASATDVEKTVYDFLDVWLIKGNVEEALRYVSKKPAFPSCWVDDGESLQWRKKRSTVLSTIKPVFERLAKDTPANSKLDNIVENQKEKIAYDLLPTKTKNLFDIYPVNKELRERILLDSCSDRKHDNSKFLIRGIESQNDLHLVLFHFKEGLLVTMVWNKENGKYRLLYLEFPLE